MWIGQCVNCNYAQAVLLLILKTEAGEDWFGRPHHANFKTLAPLLAGAKEKGPFTNGEKKSL